MFKKDWEKWEDIVKEWNTLTNELFSYMDKAAVSKILRFLDDIEKLAKKTRKKLHAQHYSMLMSLLNEIAQYGEDIIRAENINELIWNFQNLVAQMHTLLNDIVYWLRYKQLSPRAFSQAATMQQMPQYQQYAPYTATPYYNPGYTASPMTPYYYYPGYYTGYPRQRGDLSGLLSLYLLYRLLSPTGVYGAARPGYPAPARPALPSRQVQIDPNVFYNSVADLKNTIEQNADILMSKIGPDAYNRIKAQVNQLFELATRSKQTGRVDPAILQQARNIMNSLMQDGKSLTKVALPYLMASVKSLSGAIDGILQRIRAKGYIDAQDYYHLQSLYGQMVNLLRGVPHNLIKDLDPNLLNNSQKWISQYGNLLKQLQGNIGKPLPPTVINSFRELASQMNLHSSKYVSQLPQQIQSIINRSVISSLRTGQFFNPLSSLFQGQIKMPSMQKGLPQLPQFPTKMPQFPKGIPKLPTPPKVSVPQIKIPAIKPPQIGAPQIPKVGVPQVKLPDAGKALSGLIGGLTSLSRDTRMDSAVLDVGKVIGDLLFGKKK
ncbi:MAG: hypothetical protein ACP6IS_01235 [Candidatus Asgardarchaeia archaeon]